MQQLNESSRWLDETMQSLDIPVAHALGAEAEYHRIARWLTAPDSPITGHDLALYPQGSFRLGTPVRPVCHTDEFDVDLVCKIGLRKEQTTQADLKQLVGDRLKKDPDGKGRLEERRRCWTLFYQNKFHLDVLPTIPDLDHHADGILVTDTQLRLWQFSNPIGYADWFYDRMKVLLHEERLAMAKSLRVDIDEIPAWRVRTPLQRAVQVLKRHRDIYFQDNLDRRPVSIIITTLAAHAYRAEADLTEALVGIVERMEDRVERRDGGWWISNPAHLNENFADKWNEKPSLRDSFLRWRDQIHEDIEELCNVPNAHEGSIILEKSLFGVAPTRALIVPGSVQSPTSIPGVGPLTHRQQPPWPLGVSYDCSIEMRWKVPSGAGNWRSGTINRVPKHASLEFTVKANAPDPYEVLWQVTNTGEEARKANALRGGFEHGKGHRGESKSESTLYFGSHIVQAFIVKDSVIVAKSRELVVRIGNRYRGLNK